MLKKVDNFLSTDETLNSDDDGDSSKPPQRGGRMSTVICTLFTSYLVETFHTPREGSGNPSLGVAALSR